jgi:hypothetical protein
MSMAFQLNACKSSGLTQFSENLLRLHENKLSLQAEAGEPSGWEAQCRKNLPSILPGARPDACKCLQPAFAGALEQETMVEFEDKFTVEQFLVLAVSKSGLREKVASCVR